jgi:hypothetical protein
MLTVIVAGRNDDYGKDFRERLFRTALHNSRLLNRAGIDFEYLLAEWNPLPDRPPLSEEFVARVPNARAVIIPAEVHQIYSLNPQMPFHEMPAKNAALRRAKGDCVIVTNADILFSEGLVHRIAAGNFDANTLYRAHRIDVKPELDWNEIQDPANQLPSGEGKLPPPYYLGAGGDFCLAARSLWHSLRGFNEQIRFSTRAKDWQFFLSAAAQGVDIQFIGDVFHLDHDGGFRNTGAEELNTNAVHFGRWWDIEFGLPVRNSEGWGLRDLPEHLESSDPCIVLLDAKDYAIPDRQNQADLKMMPLLTRPPDSPDIAAAILLHAICAVHREKRRLVCRFEDGRLLAALSGFDAVASRVGIEIFCNWDWPAVSGYRFRPFAPEPSVLKDTDLVFEESDRGIRIYEYATRKGGAILPTQVRIDTPEFNPVLSRRLLRACLQLQKEGAKRIAIYGAGSHTRSLLQWGLPDTFELAVIVDTNTLPTLQAMAVDAVVLSSASFESDMAETAKRHLVPNIIALYGDWPADIWTGSSSPSPLPAPPAQPVLTAR